MTQQQPEEQAVETEVEEAPQAPPGGLLDLAPARLSSGEPGGSSGAPAAYAPASPNAAYQSGSLGSAGAQAGPARAQAQAQAPAAPRFRVVNGGRASLGGNVVLIKPGKVVDGASYDLGQLRSQGIQLAPLDDEPVAGG